MDVRVLGVVRTVSDPPHTLGGPTQRRLLAALALRRNEVVSVSYLVEVIWPDGTAPDRAEHNIRTYVHRLRTALDTDGDRVETVGSGYRLRLDADELDAARFEQLAGTASRLADTGDTVGALEVVDQAERLWQGTPLEEFEHEAWAVPEVVRLRELRSGVRATRAEALIDAGRPADATVLLVALVRDEPLRERPRGLLMRALYESGRQAEALRCFHEFRRMMIEEVGVEPSGDLVALDRAIAAGSLLPSSDRTRSVGGYELHERIGEGAFAVVHRATQSALNREVAVKIVRAELANQPEFVRRFEAEAQMVARIEHPNVVPLYDYWREPDRAFLVMRWMVGGSLETRLDDGPWTLDDTVTLVDQVASALDVAHEMGVVHRDVKPENILFDDDGRAYLGDFGIALMADERSRPEAALSEGSPVFASPEQLRREPVGPEADVHSLAIVAFTLLTGRTPFADTRDLRTIVRRQLHDPIPSVRSFGADLPGPVDDVLATATAKDPSARYPGAGAFATALRAAAADDGAMGAPPPALRPRTNPYKGLRPFEETDAEDFHGRARLLDELLAHLAQPDHRLLAIVGPSGSGKSSLVRAGLIPALRAGRVPGSSQWFTTTMLPGSNPFEALEAALLRVAVNAPSELLGQLRDGDRGILRGVKRILPDDDAIVVVVIDQFEETFTAAVPDEDRDLFLRGLAVAVSEPRSPVRFVLALRADFYDRPLRHPSLAPLLKRHTVAVTPLAPDELEHAIVTPAAAVGVGFDPGLVAQLIADVNHEPGALPLLQYALTQVFDQTDGDTITIDRYRSIGGLAGAVGRRAEELWQVATADEQSAIHRMFVRLVTLGEGSEDTRRRVHLAELGDAPATRAAIDRFGHARLLTFDHDPAGHQPTVEIAHEALIREWPRLRAWLDDDRDALRAHRHVTAATLAWLERDRDPNELYRGARLETAERLLGSGVVSLNEAESDFVRAGLQQQEDERAAEQRRVRRLRRLVAVTAAVAVVALIASGVAVWQRQRADDQAVAAELNALESEAARRDADDATAQAAQVAYDAETARLVAMAQTLAPTKPAQAMLLATAARQRSETPETLGALQAALSQAAPFLGHVGRGTEYIDVAWLANGHLVGVRADGIDLYDVDINRLVDSIDLEIGVGLGPPSTGTRAAGSADMIVVGGADGVVRVFSTDGSLSLLWDRPMRGPVAAVDISQPDDLVVATDILGTVAGWSLSGDELFEFSEPLPANSAAQYDQYIDRPLATRFIFEGIPVWIYPVIYGDEIYLAIGSMSARIDRTGRRRGTDVYSFVDFGDVVGPTNPRPVMDDGEHVVVAGADMVGRLDLGDGAAPTQEVYDVDVAGGGGLPFIVDTMAVRGVPVSVLRDGNAVWLDPADGTRLRTLNLGVDEVNTAVPGPRPGVVALATTSGITLVSLDGAGPISSSIPREEDQTLLTPSRDGRYVTVGGSGYVAPVNLLRRVGDGSHEDVAGLDFGPTISAGLAPDYGDPWFVWVTGRPPAPELTVFVHRLDGPEPQLVTTWPSDRGGTSGDVDPEWRWFVTGDEVSIRVHDLASGSLITELDLPPGPMDFSGGSGLRFDPSGDRLLVSGSSGSSQLYDTAAWTPVDDDVVGQYDIALGYWSDDGSLIATAAADGKITIRDGDSFEPIRKMVGPVSTSNSWAEGALLFSDDASLLLTNHDNDARLWDVATGQQIGVGFPNDERTNSGINTGETLQLVTGAAESALVWNLDVAEWAGVACRVAGSNLTRDEWEQWGPRDEDYRPICDQYPVES